MRRSPFNVRTATGALLTGILAGVVSGLLLLVIHAGRAVLLRQGLTRSDPLPDQPLTTVPPPAALLSRGLLIPVQGISPSGLRDVFLAARGGGRVHHALDIMAPRGTPVLATDAGTLVRVMSTGPGGLSLYQHDASGQYCYYYAHLDAYAPGLAPGQALARGQVLGYVGSTGNASPSAPHLHFAISEVQGATRGCNGPAVNPYPLLGR